MFMRKIALLIENAHVAVHIYFHCKCATSVSRIHLQKLRKQKEQYAEYTVYDHWSLYWVVSITASIGVGPLLASEVL